jgi:hypothetical protein
MASSARQLIRRVAIIFAAMYPVVVVSFSVLKATTASFDAAPWPEIFYGPAITIGCCYLLFYVAVKLECWIRDRA